MKTKQKIGYLYINGLININIKFIDNLVDWCWNKEGINIEHSYTNWFDDKKIEERIIEIVNKVNQMLKTYDGVVIIGSSAGGSLAINSFDRLKDKNVCIVIAHGRLKVGKYSKSQKLSLYHSARIGTKKPASSFYNSVKIAEEKIIPKLSNNDKKRIFTMTQLTDCIVPIESMIINGTKTHHSIAFGHRMGFIAHLIFGRKIIKNFAENYFNSK